MLISGLPNFIHEVNMARTAPAALGWGSTCFNKAGPMEVELIRNRLDEPILPEPDEG
jgi:hypothetical protein